MCEIKVIYRYCFIYHHAIIWEDGDFDLRLYDLFFIFISMFRICCFFGLWDCLWR